VRAKLHSLLFATKARDEIVGFLRDGKYLLDDAIAGPGEINPSRYATVVEKQEAPRLCSPSDSTLFAKNESESHKSARANP